MGVSRWLAKNRCIATHRLHSIIHLSMYSYVAHRMQFSNMKFPFSRIFLATQLSIRSNYICITCSNMQPTCMCHSLGGYFPLSPPKIPKIRIRATGRFIILLDWQFLRCRAVLVLNFFFCGLYEAFFFLIKPSLFLQASCEFFYYCYFIYSTILLFYFSIFLLFYFLFIYFIPSFRMSIPFPYCFFLYLPVPKQSIVNFILNSFAGDCPGDYC